MNSCSSLLHQYNTNSKHSFSYSQKRTYCCRKMEIFINWELCEEIPQKMNCVYGIKLVRTDWKKFINYPKIYPFFRNCVSFCQNTRITEYFWFYLHCFLFVPIKRQNFSLNWNDANLNQNLIIMSISKPHLKHWID